MTDEEQLRGGVGARERRDVRPLGQGVLASPLGIAKGAQIQVEEVIVVALENDRHVSKLEPLCQVPAWRYLRANKFGFDIIEGGGLPE